MSKKTLAKKLKRLRRRISNLKSEITSYHIMLMTRENQILELKSELYGRETKESASQQATN